MNNVNKTLYIPLYGKAYVSKKGLFIEDKKAEYIWEKESFELKGKSKSKWLAYYMGMRSFLFDEWVKNKSEVLKDAVVIHIGCGMDNRIGRVDRAVNMWYDVDFPNVIEERKRYYVETENYRMIGADVRDDDWISEIPETNSVIVVMEGVSMYMTEEEIGSLFEALGNRFKNISLMMDSYTVLAAKLSKYKNPINDVGVTLVYGVDNPRIFEKGGFVFSEEHSLTPEKLINQLRGAEKIIFKNLYAGKLSKKLYKLFEYKKET